MKKLVAAAIVSCILLGSGAVFAQTQQSHGVSVTIPQLLMIRIVAGDSNAAVASPDAVEFALDAGTFEPAGVNLHTNTPNWSDIRVFTNDPAGWRVSVETVGGSTDFAWGKIEVTRTNGDSFNLPEQNASVAVASDQARTEGWLSLGISPASYVLTLEGDEDPETYSTTVVYTIAVF